MSALTAQDIIRMLGLKPHPEGGHFRETFRDSKQNPDGRPASTAPLKEEWETIARALLV